MSATFDATTTAAYDAATTAQSRAEAIVASLAGTISVKVFNGSNTEMGSGTMASPWATAVSGVVVLGEVTEFTVGTTGTPDANWYIRFENSDASRWVRGSFGLADSGQDYTWSLATWTATQTGTIGTATIIAAGNAAPVFTVAPPTAGIAATGGTIQFTAVDPDGSEVVYSLTTTRAGITIDSTGLVTVTAAAAGTSGNIVVQASDGILTDTATCAVTVNSAEAANLFDDGFETFAVGDLVTSSLYNFGGTLGNTPTIIASPTREGSRAMRAWITAGSSTRCEVYPAGMEVMGNPYLYRDVRGWGPRPYYYEFDTTHPDGVSATPTAIKPILAQGFWYGFSIYVPTVASELYNNGTYRDIFCQFHSERDPVDLTKNPIATLSYYEGRWRLRWNYDTAQGYDGSYTATYSHDEMYGVYSGCQKSLAWNESTGLEGGFDGDRGRWTDWVFNICWDFRANSTVGKMDVWKNGQQVLRYRGPIGYNDILGPYQKVGCYPVSGQASAPAREVYIDAIRFADPEAGSYEMVAPRGSR
jgi:hypothetical protein